ncbi:MAG TPA: DUF6067 family protein, partial [bacterium]|nr:DUF6067 family protein [bacterium]
MRKVAIWLTSICLFWAGRDLLAAWSAPVPREKLPYFSVPKMSRPPVIDGVIDPQEWQESVAVSGVGGCTSAILIARPTTYYLAWDDHHLYWAVRTWVRPNYKPRVSGREPHSASAFDDGCEFHFKPMGKNVPPGRTDSSFKFMINCLGVDGEMERISVGQQFKNWNPNFRRAFRLTPPGSAPSGGSWWECEVAATTEDFELVKPNQPGDQWKFMLGFNHLYFNWTQARIPAITSYFDPGGYPVGTLVEQTPSIQFFMEELPGPLDGRAALKVKSYNPGPREALLNLSVVFTDLGQEKLVAAEKMETKTILEKKEVIRLQPGQSYLWQMDEPFGEKLGPRLGTIEVEVKQANQLLFRYFTYLKQEYPREALAPAVVSQEDFPLKVTFNPVKNNLFFVADSYYLPEPEKASQVSYRILPENSTRPVAEGLISEVRTYYFRRLIPLGPLTPGRYIVQAFLHKKDGTTLGPVQTSFTKLDEARVFADWWNTRLGDTERVIKPFTPMQQKGKTVSVWGRSYTLNQLGLPEKIVSRNKPVSAAPARIVVSSRGKRQAFTFSGSPVFTEVKPWRVGFQGQAAAGALLFKSSG